MVGLVVVAVKDFVDESSRKFGENDPIWLIFRWVETTN